MLVNFSRSLSRTGIVEHCNLLSTALSRRFPQHCKVVRRLFLAQRHVDDVQAYVVERRDDLIVIDVERWECSTADGVNVFSKTALDQ